jgi:acyl-CoA synthetase (AMP-forming)/AMP-acid ligase II
MLGSSDLDYLISIFALSRLGYAVLLLSTRLSVEAIAKLLESTDSEDILVSPAMETVVRKVQEVRSLNSALIPQKDAYSKYTKNSDTYLTGDAVKSKKWAFIIHSSGSTGLPKPIFQTHSACIANYATSKPYEPLITLPLYHNHGISTFFRAVFKAKKATLYNANLPLTGTYLRKAIEITKPESFHGVPYALKLLSEVDGGTEALATCNQVLFGGSSCPDELGDKLVAQGVNLVGHYGSYVFCCICSIYP